MKTLKAVAARYNATSLILRIVIGLVVGAVLALAVCSAAAFAALRSAASFLLYSMMAATDPKRPAGACFASCTCKQLNRCDFVG